MWVGEEKRKGERERVKKNGEESKGVDIRKRSVNQFTWQRTTLARPGFMLRTNIFTSSL